MIEATRVPEEYISGTGDPSSWQYLTTPMAAKRIIGGVDEIQFLYVAPRTTIKTHGHDNQWEVWVRISHKTAHICLIGEEHTLVNDSDEPMTLMAIKGHINYSYDDLAELFGLWGFSVEHGSLIVND